MAVIPEFHAKIKKKLCKEGYVVLPLLEEIDLQTSKDKGFNVDIYEIIRELCLRDVIKRKGDSQGTVKKSQKS
jgi:hypothetical protein